MFHARDFDKIDAVLDPHAAPAVTVSQAQIDAALIRSRELRANALRDLWALVTGKTNRA
ncbi:MAG: hypothetical protein AAFR46_09450 [Pseudomonadota bacterium]